LQEYLDRNVSLASMLSYGTQGSRMSARSRLSRRSVLMVEEALALPPEDREFNDAFGDAADAEARAASTAARGTSNYGTLNGSGLTLDVGSPGRKFAHTLMDEDAPLLANDAVAAFQGKIPVAEAVFVPQEPVTTVKLMDKSFLEQVKSPEWRFLLVLSVITIYRTQWYVTSTGPYLASIGDKHNVFAPITVLIMSFEAAVVVRRLL
jgi:hypothetical protein